MLILHSLVVSAGFALILLAPPAEGFQLLVPLDGAARARMLPLAIARGAALVGRGPLPGSFVVTGRHAAIGASLAAAGILTFAAPAAACGQTEDDHG